MDTLAITCILSWIFIAVKNCCGSEINLFMAGNNGEIRTPNYPQHYPLNFSCTWTIQSGNGKKIRLKFLDFRIEKAKRCIYDYVQIRDDKNIAWTSRDTLKLCGNDLPKDIIARGRFLQIRFHSDKHNLVDRGFLAKWTAEGGSVESTKVCSTKYEFVTKSIPCQTPTPLTVTAKVGCSSRESKPRVCTCPNTETPKRSITTSKNLISPSTSKVVPVSTLRDMSSAAPAKPTVVSNTVEVYGGKGQNTAAAAQGMREDKIILIVFIAFVSLLLLINLLLIFFLWKRNKQVGELKMLSKSRIFSSKQDEFLGDQPPRRRNTKNVYDYKAVPSTSSSSNGNTVKSVNRYIERILRSGKYDTEDTSISSQQNAQQDKFLSMLTDVIRPVEVDLQSLSSDTNDGDVSDEYVSTELSDHMTPSGTTRS